MISAKKVLDRVFVERCNITKDIHRNKFEYLVEVKGFLTEPSFSVQT